MINITNKNKIYVFCPAYLKTGGPELLHQLVYKLNLESIEAYIVYSEINNKKTNYTVDDFKKYINKYYTEDEIEDSEDNIIIFPEIYINKLKKYKKSQKAIWWLSVDNYLSVYSFLYNLKRGNFKDSFRCIKKILNIKGYGIKRVKYNLCQSYYGIDFCKKQKLKNIMFLSDYINEEYFKSINIKKEDIVLYNPKKGIEFTKKIISKSKDLNWVPIQGLTTSQVKELMEKSKVYIDFGNHPGKDRFPREASMCNCCIITGKRGSAKFYEDLPISNEFKFKDVDKNINNIVNKIRLCINNFEDEVKKQDGYREFIKNEEEKFEQDINKIFIRMD